MSNRNISVIGLGYVGLPVAVAFGRIGRVVGFDINANRIEQLQSLYDNTLEVSADDLKQADIHFTSNLPELAEADFHIVAVPTPINESREPDFGPLFSASRTVGKILKAGDIVVFESTVYPGATEEDCIPILEQESGLTFGKDFTVGYSPERINPGDKERSFETITKIVSGSDPETLDIVSEVYESVLKAGIHRASSIKVAEAAKVIENTQRDLNIALMNELSLIFQKMQIDTLDVLEAAGTKWNFLPFRPGLVGGHCISVDPHYLTHKARLIGYHPDVIQAGRRVNDDMAKNITQTAIKKLIIDGKDVSSIKVAILGLTYKENTPDLRNTKVVDIIEELATFGITPIINDPWAEPAEAKQIYNVELTELSDIEEVDLLFLTVAHEQYADLSEDKLEKIMNAGAHIWDIKGILDRDAIANAGYSLHRI